ncbi:MAG: hypothetical protein V3V14_02520 [Saprospiraceae bacterium]
MNKSLTIIIISVLSLLGIIGFVYYTISTFDFPEFYTQEEKMYEYNSQWFHLPGIIPAILGFWISKKSPIKPLVFYGYIAYVLLVALTYYAAITATDPIAAGMLLVALLIPFSVAFSILVLINLKKQ